VSNFATAPAILPHEKGTFVIDGNSIVLTPTHLNTGIMANTLKWSKIGLAMRMVYPDKTLPYTLSGDILKLIDIGIQQAFKKVDPFFTIDKKGNIVFQFS
jgi:hypothetical protein